MPSSASSSISYPPNVKCFKSLKRSPYPRDIDVKDLPLEIKNKFLLHLQKNNNTHKPFPPKGFVEGDVNDAHYRCAWDNRDNPSSILGPLDRARQSFGGILNTQNNHGNVMTISSVLVDVLNDSIQPEDQILEIGSSKGFQAFQMLSRGAFVTGVDFSHKDLREFESDLKKIPNHQTLLSRWTKIVGRFPDGKSLQQLEKNKFDTVLMSHVAHYLTGPDLRVGIKKIHEWLKNGGRFFFQALTPYSNPYATHISEFEKKHSNNEEWPGYHEKTNSTGVFMPSKGHPIHPDIIKRELEQAGFKIDMINYASLMNLPHDHPPALADARNRAEDSYTVMPRTSGSGGLPNGINQGYPVTYQELEKFVKNNGTKEELIEIANKLQKRKDLYKQALSDQHSFAFTKAIDNFNTVYFNRHKQPLGLTRDDFLNYDMTNGGFENKSKDDEYIVEHQKNPTDVLYASAAKASIFFKTYPQIRQALILKPKIAYGVLNTMETVIVIAHKPKSSKRSLANNNPHTRS